MTLQRPVRHDGTSLKRKEVSNIYSPALDPALVRPLYRLGRVRGVPMTDIVNFVMAAYIEEAAPEIEQYNAALHDRHRRRRVDRKRAS